MRIIEESNPIWKYILFNVFFEPCVVCHWRLQYVRDEKIFQEVLLDCFKFSLNIQKSSLRALNSFVRTSACNPYIPPTASYTHRPPTASTTWSNPKTVSVARECNRVSAMSALHPVTSDRPIRCRCLPKRIASIAKVLFDSKHHCLDYWTRRGSQNCFQHGFCTSNLA